LVNGEPVLRKQWRSTRISANDNVQFVSRPWAGTTTPSKLSGSSR
jgi:hypothetical protein